MSSNRFYYSKLSEILSFLPPIHLFSSGGGNMGSIAILNNFIYLKTFSIIFGISLAKSVEDNSKQGLVLTSIKKTLKSSSII